MPANKACPSSFVPNQLRVSVAAQGWAPDCPNFRPLVFWIPWDGERGFGTFDGVTVGVEAFSNQTAVVTLVINRGLCSGSNVSTPAGVVSCNPFFWANFIGGFHMDCCGGGFGETTFSVTLSSGVPAPSVPPPPEKPLPCPSSEGNCCGSSVPANVGPLFGVTARGFSAAWDGSAPAVSSNPIRFASGALELSATDLSSSGFGIPWGHTRRFKNLTDVPQTVGNGMNWSVDQWPYLIRQQIFSPATETIYVDFGARGAYWFDRTAADFEPRFGEDVTLELISLSQVYRLTERNGTVTEFNATTGMFKRRYDAGGNQVEVTALAANGYSPAEVESTATVGSDTITEQYLYQYSAPTGNAQVDSVTLRRKTNSGPWTNVARALYDYYTPSDTYGSDGDLKLVVTQNHDGSNWVDIGKTLYRYDTANAPPLPAPPGMPQGTFHLHLLKYVVLPESYERLAADPNVSDPLTASNAIVAQYADHYFEYDASTAGTLASVIAAAGGFAAAFPQSSYVRWTTNQYSDCCLLASQRVYFDIPTSGAGTPGTHYNETSFGYDSMRRRDRTTQPGGGVNLQTFDPRGLPLQDRVGVDDDGTIIDIVLISENEYDHGLAGGDGNRTKLTEHVDATTTRVTEYEFDWRNRQTVIDGELDFYQVSTFDNLNREIRIDQRDTNAAGTLVARSETQFDNWGRVYRTIRYGVNRQTGAITGDQTHNATYDQAYNVLREEPAGQSEYQESQCNSLGQRTQTSDPLGNTPNLRLTTPATQFPPPTR